MKISAKTITYDAMLAAMCAVLGCFSVDMGNLKISIESFPILLGALCFGPSDGLLIALAGTFISQLIMYGLSVTTIVWMAPYLIAALFIGCFAEKNNLDPGKKQLFLIVLFSELLIVVLNTGALFIDSKVFGYYSAVYVLGSVPVRCAIAAIRIVLYFAALPPVIKTVKKLYS